MFPFLSGWPDSITSASRLAGGLQCNGAISSRLVSLLIRSGHGDLVLEPLVPIDEAAPRQPLYVGGWMLSLINPAHVQVDNVEAMNRRIVGHASVIGFGRFTKLRWFIIQVHPSQLFNGEGLIELCSSIYDAFRIALAPLCIPFVLSFQTLSPPLPSIHSLHTILDDNARTKRELQDYCRPCRLGDQKLLHASGARRRMNCDPIRSAVG